VHTFVVEDQRPPPNNWNSCWTGEIVRAHAWCRVFALYEIRSAWCGRTGILFVSP
jgi:hypothetical protein